MGFHPAIAFKRFRFETFALHYETYYSLFSTRHILEDRTHPLHLVKAREAPKRERTGLWWHVTVNANSSKTKVVRRWLSRRLRNAFVQELKDRGINEDGKLMNSAGVRKHSAVLGDLLDRGRELSLRGSIRMHIKPQLVTAEYGEVREETGKIIEVLLRGLEADMVARTSPKPTPPKPQQTMPRPLRPYSHASPKPFRSRDMPARPRPNAAPLPERRRTIKNLDD